MTKLLQRVDVNLRSFYIFNSKFGRNLADGEEHKKIVYYYPDDIELNTKIKDVGLSEAIIAFTSNFTEATNDCKSLHTQKTTQVFFQPEADYWMVIVLNVPKEIRSKDGIEVAEYRGGEVHERIYRAMLEQCYYMFRLFHGTFQMNYMTDETADEEISRLRLQQKLTSFYDKHITTIKLPAYNIMDMTKSLQFLALPKQTFLIAHNFINTLLETFAPISEAILLYKENIICSGKVSPFDLYYLHKFIVEEELLSKMPITETTGGTVTTVLSRSDSTIAECYRNGAFITNLIQLNEANETDKTNLPKLYLGGKSSTLVKPYFLIVYRALDALMCLLIDAEKGEPGQQLYEEIHTCMGPKLASISRDITESINSNKQAVNKSTTSLNSLNSSSSSGGGTTCALQTAAADATARKFLFIDERSFKHLCNITIDRKRPQLTTFGNMPSSVLQLIVDLDEQDEKTDENMTSGGSSSSPFKESILKATNDFWIFKRSRNWRKYYVIIFNNKSTLLDITAEAMRIFEQEQIDDVFFDK